ncbi:hypothetical protein [Nocardioides massiliensis]|uniref:Cbb3-type cytochrome oxidase assembly protein CcoS n=1 Tax=Nocardioides massiliensis TaxID=1325935 RepID=A0ABT9NPV1_9ACTN|nr:hypothetical protein [Nocardioides massiliensis]MDP9822302.1 hypothetical protein [Nocardioides massiliensis]
MEFLPYLIFMVVVALAVAITTFGITTWVYVQGNKDEDDTKSPTATRTDREMATSGARR